MYSSVSPRNCSFHQSDPVTSPMVNHPSESTHSYSHYQHSHSDSSRSSSVGSSSVSPSTVASTSMTLTAAAVPRTTSTTALGDIDPILAQHVEYELGLTKRNGATGSGTRKNAWGNLSYAELISKAITTSAEQRLTLSEIYDWMIKYVPFFRNKVDRVSSAGWKNSIRHNLSLHNRFKRIQGEGTGKSSWWIINPDEKATSSPSNTHSSINRHGIKQGRRRSAQINKTSPSSSVNTPKRLRNIRSTKPIRSANTNHRQTQESVSAQQISPLDIASIPVYDSHQWTTRVESDNSVNHLYEQDFYSTSINTPLTNSNGNSTGGIQSSYPFDDGALNYPSTSSSSNNVNSNNNTTTNNTNTSSSDYSYNHFSHHPQSLYHQHTSNYAMNSNDNNYYSPQSMINDHPTNDCHLPLDSYSSNGLLNYVLQPQQAQQLIDPSDDQQLFLRAHSRSSQSSSSLSPPMLINQTPLSSSSSSTSSSSGYSYSHKNSLLTSGYHPPNSTGTLTLYGHHHNQYHHSNIETMLHLNCDDEGNEGDDDDDDDLSTLVHHHHGIIDDHPTLLNVLPGNHHSFHAHQDPSSSLLRTVLQRSTINLHNHPL